MNMNEPNRQPLLERIERGAEGVAAYLTLISAALIFLGVVLRNTVSASPSWITEIPTYGFVWAVFLSLACAFSRGPQLGLDIVVRQLPMTYQRILHLFGSLAMVSIAAIMAWLGFELCIRQLSTGAVSNTALRFPLGVVTLAMVLGFILLFLHGLSRFRTDPSLPESKERKS